MVVSLPLESHDLPLYLYYPSLPEGLYPWDNSGIIVV